MTRYRNKYNGTVVNTEQSLGYEWGEISDDAPLVLVAESGRVLDAQGELAHPANPEELIESFKKTPEEVKSDAADTGDGSGDEPREGSDSERAGARRRTARKG